MLRFRIPEIVLGALLATAIFAIGLSVGSSFFPQNYRPEQNSTQASQHKSADRSAEERTADYTWYLAVLNGVLTVSTILLWWVTRRSAKIAERALTELERPYVFFHGVSSDLKSFFRPTTTWNPQQVWPSFQLIVVNYGRTPANIEQSVILFRILDSIPEHPALPNIGSSEPNAGAAFIVVGPDKEFHFPPVASEDEFGPEHVQKIRNRILSFFCHGSFVYRDIFGRRHTTEFCRRYDVRFNEWIPEGGQERNYSS